MQSASMLTTLCIEVELRNSTLTAILGTAFDQVLSVLRFHVCQWGANRNPCESYQMGPSPTPAYSKSKLRGCKSALCSVVLLPSTTIFGAHFITFYRMGEKSKGG